MKVTVENKKGLNKDLKVFIDKETMNSYMDEKYEEIKGSVNLKGFRPGKVPKEILKRQFGKAVFGEVLDKVLKETSTKALEENKIKPAGQPKLDLKTYGEDKDLEYVLSVTELPKVEIKSLENIKFDEYTVKIDDSETDKRIKEIAKNQPNFKEVSADTKAKKGDLVSLDYKATVDGKDFKGSEGKNTQLTLGKDLFLKGFDEQLIGVKKDDEKIVEATLPENFPEKELVNKKAKFNCKILSVKQSEEVKIDDDFAKNLGAKDLKDLKTLISKQINDEYKNSLDQLSKNQILKEIEKIKVDEVPENLVEEEVKVLSQGMSEEEAKKNKKNFEKPGYEIHQSVERKVEGNTKCLGYSIKELEHMSPKEFNDLYHPESINDGFKIISLLSGTTNSNSTISLDGVSILKSKNQKWITFNCKMLWERDFKNPKKDSS